MQILREFLKQEFQIDLPISGGAGNSPAEPIVIDIENGLAASRVQMDVANCLYRRCSWHWRVIAKDLLPSVDRKIERLSCEVKYPEGDQIVTEKRNLYFDVSKTQLEAGKGTPVCGFGLGIATKIGLPFQIEWLHFDQLINNEPDNPGLGVTIAYSAPYTKATIYVYNKQLEKINDQTNREAFLSEFDLAIHDFHAINPGAELLAESLNENFLFKSFDVDSAYSAVMLLTISNYFFKVRLTFNGSTDRYAFDCMSESLSQIISMVSAMKKIQQKV